MNYNRLLLRPTFESPRPILSNNISEVDKINLLFITERNDAVEVDEVYCNPIQYRFNDILSIELYCITNVSP